MKWIRVRQPRRGVEHPIDAAERGFRVVTLAEFGDLGQCATCAHMGRDYRCSKVGLDLELRGAATCCEYQRRPGRPRQPKHDMTIPTLVADIQQAGLRLERRGDSLHVQPASRLTRSLRTRIRANRAELLELISEAPF